LKAAQQVWRARASAISWIAIAALSQLDAYAATESDNISVTVDVVESCEVAAGTMAFDGAAYGTHIDQTLDLTVACSQGTDATVTLSQGATSDDSSTEAAPVREMATAGATLSYQLYSDHDRTKVWGNTNQTGKGYSAETSSNATITVYGRVAADQEAAPSRFSDTVVATIVF
jgi:spore coat protein U-like protein